jgi:sortase A
VSEGVTHRVRLRHDWRWFLGLVGRVLIAMGVLTFAFVGYQLWGTRIEFEAGQNGLESEFEDLQDQLVGTEPATTVPPTAVPTTTLAPTTAAPATTVGTAPTTSPAANPPTTTVAPTTQPPTTTTAPAPTLPQFKLGDGIAAIKIPAATDKTYYVVSGVRVQDLKIAVGHYPSTPMPGFYGNAALAGHRTTYGAPFEHLDRLKPGDRIYVDTVLREHYEYVVYDTKIVTPSDTWVIGQPTDPNDISLTLTTCHPKRSTKQRLVIFSRLDQAASSAPRHRDAAPATTPSGELAGEGDATPVTTVPATTAPATTAPATTTAATSATTRPAATTGSTVLGATATVATAPATTLAPTTAAAPTTVAAVDEQTSERDAEALARGWFHDDRAWFQIFLWGSALTVISIAAWRLSVRTKHNWIGFAVGIFPFLFALYFFYQNLNRLLPPGL